VAAAAAAAAATHASATSAAATAIAITAAEELRKRGRVRQLVPSDGWQTAPAAVVQCLVEDEQEDAVADEEVVQEGTSLSQPVASGGEEVEARFRFSTWLLAGISFHVTLDQGREAPCVLGAVVAAQRGWWESSPCFFPKVTNDTKHSTQSTCARARASQPAAGTPGALCTRRVQPVLST
jgi:hypothetical protein